MSGSLPLKGSACFETNVTKTRWTTSYTDNGPASLAADLSNILSPSTHSVSLIELVVSLLDQTLKVSGHSLALQESSLQDF